MAGPFDLGTVVVRAALHVDPETAQITAVTRPDPDDPRRHPARRAHDRAPHRPHQFTLNPTNCDPMAITGTRPLGPRASAALSNRFQVGGCPALPFKPKLALSLKGATKRTGHPALSATLTAKPGEANIARAQVTLPHSDFLDNAHIGTVCTRVQFAAHQLPRRLASTATPPRSPRCSTNRFGHRLPALLPPTSSPTWSPPWAARSRSPSPARSTPVKGGGLRNTFEAVPDAPVSKFTLEMQGGSKGLLLNSATSAPANRATVHLNAQNGMTHDSRPLVTDGCQAAVPRRRSPRPRQPSVDRSPSLPHHNGTGPLRRRRHLRSSLSAACAAPSGLPGAVFPSPARPLSLPTAEPCAGL